MGRTLAVVCSLALVAGACSSSEARPAASDTSSSSTTTTPAYEPVFEPGACDPARVTEKTATVECGTLVVPEDRSKPTARTVRLPVAILRASVEPKQPDPIIYFSGGPGYAGLQSANHWAKIQLKTDRDIITFDQRGTGKADPSLDCPEVDDATFAMFETSKPPIDETPPMLDAFDRCRDRLTGEGIDLDMYDTPVVADDVADLRRALKLDQWNIFGISYGTTVALEMLRSHAEGVRSVVIDSVYPPDALLGPLVFGEADRVFNTLVHGCAADAACAAAHPDLGAELDRAVARLDASPYALDITVGDRVVKGKFTGTDLIGGLFNALYDTELIPLLPLFIKSVADGNTGILDGVAQDGITFLTTAAEGQSASVDCADRERLVDQAKLTQAVKDNPRYGLLAAARPIPQICPAWNVAPVDEAFNEVHETTVPTLVFGDEYDPVTPPATSERTARSLGASATFVKFPGLGHGATDAHPCPMSIFRAFIDTPTVKPDTSCVASMPPPKWKV